MKTRHVISASLVLLAAPLYAATLTTTAIDSGGRRTTSANYVNDASIGGIFGISSGPSDTAKNGYIGQLTELASLAITATPASVAETAAAQLTAKAILDDATVLALSATDTVWSAAAFPLASISAGGFVTTLAVYTNTSATVTGLYLGVTGNGSLLVLDTNPDNFGSYSGDGLPDGWQVGYFGLNNTNAAPNANPDGDAFSNLGEYIADTNPTNLLSYFRITAHSNQSPAKLVFVPSSAIRTYTLEATTNLVTGPWNPVPGQTNIPGTGATLPLSDTNGTSATHYRVRVIAP